MACPVGSTAHGGHCSEHDRPPSAVPRHAVEWSRRKLCSLARIARLRCSTASSKRVAVLEAGRGLVQWATDRKQPPPARHAAREQRYRVPSHATGGTIRRLSGPRAELQQRPHRPKAHRPHLISHDFKLARPRTSKLILSLTPLVLPSRAVATLELLFVIISWPSSFRFFVPRLLRFPYLPSTLLYLPLRPRRRPH